MNIPKEAEAINSSIMQRSDKIINPVLTIGMENIDDALKKVEGLGGKIVQGKMEVLNMGITAFSKTPKPTFGTSGKSSGLKLF